MTQYDRKKTMEEAARDAQPVGLRALLRLAVPVTLSRLGTMLMGLTDAIVVGHHSSLQLGYHALGWAVTSVILMTGVGLLMGVQVMAARMIGTGRPGQAVAVLWEGLLYAGMLGILSSTAVLLLGPSILGFAHVDASMLGPAAAVLRIFALSLPLYLVSTACMLWLEGLSRPMPALVIMWVANAVNLMLNLWFVPGHNPFGVEGAAGSAWATMGARFTLFAILLGYILLSRDLRRQLTTPCTIQRLEDASSMRRIGYGAGASYFAEVGAFAALSVIAGRMGPIEVAAWAVILNIASLLFMIPMGIGAATAVLVSGAAGRSHFRGIQDAGRLGFLTAGVSWLLVWTAVGLLTAPLARIYTDDPVLNVILVPALAVASAFFGADGFQNVVATALRARGDVFMPTVTHFLSYLVVMLPLGILLGLIFEMGLYGIIYATIIASFISSALLLGRWRQLSTT